MAGYKSKAKENAGSDFDLDALSIETDSPKESLKPSMKDAKSYKEVVVINEEEKKDVARLVYVRPIKVYNRVEGTMRGVSMIPGAKLTLAPIVNSSGEIETGHTKKEWEEYTFTTVDRAYWLDFRIVLTDTDLVLDVNKERDLLIYKFLKIRPEIATSPDKITPYTKFLMYDEVEEAKKSNLKVKSKVKALGLLDTMTFTEQEGFLKLFGYKTKSMSGEVIFSRLAQLAEKDPLVFIALYNSPDKEDKIFVNSLLQYELITKQHGTYMFNEISLGVSIEQVINFINLPTNTMLKDQLLNMLDIKYRL